MRRIPGKPRLFTFLGGLLGDLGTTLTILMVVFVLTIVLGVVLLMFSIIGEPFAYIGVMMALVFIPIVLLVGLLMNTLLNIAARRGRTFLTRPFERVESPAREFYPRYRKTYIAQKMTSFGIAILVFLFSMFVSTILFLIPPSIHPICCFFLPISFPFILMTITMPAIAWLSFGYAFDPYEPEPRGYLVIALVWGMLSTFPSLFMNTFNSLWMENLGLDTAVFSAPFVEEFFKSLGFVLIFSQIQDETDGILYGILFGSGFALVENFLYGVNVIAAAGGIGFFLLIGFRSFFNMVVHIIGPGIIGFFLGMARAGSSRVCRKGLKGRLCGFDVLLPFIAIPLLLAGILNHMVWNFIAGLSIFSMFLLIFIGFFEFFLLVFLVLLGFLIATGRFNRTGRSERTY